MACMLQRCPSLLRVSTRAALQSSLRSRTCFARPFSSTVVVLAESGKKGSRRNDPRNALEFEAPDDFDDRPRKEKRESFEDEEDEGLDEEEMEQDVMTLARDGRKVVGIREMLSPPDNEQGRPMTGDELEELDLDEDFEPPVEPGFFAMEEDKEDQDDDEEWENDDMTSMGHAELEQHREVREFYRVIAWDMPLLWNHRKEYKPPTAAQPLRFRYTTYLGENHPASRKVVVDFTPSDLPGLTPQQTTKLIKILGTRYNPEKDRAKISCELFPNAAQNKRWIGDMLDKLMSEAKDTKDTFEDIPFDFRHHKVKRKIVFPEEWKLTEERMAYLESKRAVAESERVKQLMSAEQVEPLTATPSTVAKEIAIDAPWNKWQAHRARPR